VGPQQRDEPFPVEFQKECRPNIRIHQEMCPKTLDEWRKYYFANVKPEEHIVELGKRLYVKITEVIQSEVAEITEEDCIKYMKQLVIDRTFLGYETEIQTVYGQLEGLLDVKIQPAPDKWDRLYNVDFFVKVGDSYIGLQIKPISFNGGTIQLPEIFKEKSIQEETHRQFTEMYGGKVFYIYSFKNGQKKEIYNMDVIDEIRNELIRLRS